DRDRERDEDDERRAGEQHERVAADHEQLAMREVDEPHDPEHDRHPERDQRVKAAEAEPVDERLDQELDVHVAAPWSPKYAFVSSSPDSRSSCVPDSTRRPLLSTCERSANSIARTALCSTSSIVTPLLRSC